jgi:hypothetical protein
MQDNVRVAIHIKTRRAVKERILTKINRCPLENACVISVTR